MRNWEYVDLVELLPASDAAGDTYPSGPPSARVPLFPGCEVVRHKKCQIETIAQWTQAFAVYMAVLISEHPTATLELLVYMLTTIKASQQYDGLLWRSYDTNYRIAAAVTNLGPTWTLTCSPGSSQAEQNCFTQLCVRQPIPLGGRLSGTSWCGETVAGKVAADWRATQTQTHFQDLGTRRMQRINFQVELFLRHQVQVQARLQ